MACVPVSILVISAIFQLSSARSGYLEKSSLDVEIGREGQVLMRQDSPKLRDASLLENEVADDSRPRQKQRRGPRNEAIEAFADPHKIDDSWLHDVSFRMPPFIEKYPNFYACSFVGASILFLMAVCFHVQYEDYKETQIRARVRLAQRQAMAAASALGRGAHRMGASFTPPRGRRAPAPHDLQTAAEAAAAMWATPSLHPAPNFVHSASASAADEDFGALSDAGFSDVALSDAPPRSEAAHSARSNAMRSDGGRSLGARSDGGRSVDALSEGGRSVGVRSGRSIGALSSKTPSEAARFEAAHFEAQSFEPEPAERATFGEAAAAAVDKGAQTISRLSDAVGNFTGVLAGENTKMPTFKSTFESTDVTTASGTSTPRSQLSSQQASDLSYGSNIRSGTVLKARLPEVIFASTKSWQEIGELAPGQKVVAAAAPELVDAYTMVPIKPRGAVDLKTLEVMEK